MRDILQRHVQTAHSSFRQAPRVMGVLTVVFMLLLSSGAVVAQQSDRIVIDDFEDGDTSEWSAEAMVTTDNPLEGDYSMVQTPDASGGVTRPVEKKNYTRLTYLHEVRSDAISVVTYNHVEGGVQTTAQLGVEDYEIIQSDGGTQEGTGVTVPGNTTLAFSSKFNWDSGTVEHSVRYYENGTVIWEGDPVALEDTSGVAEIEYLGFDSKVDLFTANGTEGEIALSDTETALRIDTRDLVFPDGSTHPYEVVLENVSRVTDNATVTSSNSTLLSVNETENTITSINDSNATGVVNLTANYTHEGQEYTTTKQVVVAEASMQNLELLPTGLWRTYAVMSDNTIFALIIAALFSVAAARFAGAFAGLATAEMVIVIGWLGGYVGLGIAMVSVFMCMFIGLNLAANIDYSVTRMER